MAHSLVSMAAASTPFPVVAVPYNNSLHNLRLNKGPRSIRCSTNEENGSCKIASRREFMYVLVGASIGFTLTPAEASAARRPPPPPPGEKKDPSLSALQAKVLASKKRKEAMKVATAKQREKGTAVSE